MVRFRLAVAYGRHLRVGEHHGRHRGQVQGRVTAGHVDRGASAGRCRHIDELRLVGAVACGVDVFHACRGLTLSGTKTHVKGFWS